MTKVGELVNRDEIFDTIIIADKRSKIQPETISKYVSALHKKLKDHYGREVITNQRDSGWIFSPLE
jgi:DNA-binding response OmpR family regulator